MLPAPQIKSQVPPRKKKFLPAEDGVNLCAPPRVQAGWHFSGEHLPPGCLTAVNIYAQVWVGYMLPCLLGKYCWVEYIDIFFKATKLFSKVDVSFCIPTISVPEFWFLPILVQSWYGQPFQFHHFNRGPRGTPGPLHLLLPGDSSHGGLRRLSRAQAVTCASSLIKCLFKAFAHFLIRFFFFHFIGLWEIFIFLDIHILYQLFS